MEVEAALGNRTHPILKTSRTTSSGPKRPAPKELHAHGSGTRKSWLASGIATTGVNRSEGADERRSRRPHGVHGLGCFRGRPLCSPAAREERDMDSSVLWVVGAVVGFILLILLFRTTRGRRG